MNAKLRKTVKIAAAGLFLAALAINVKVTLDDPFNMGIANEKALAEQTTTCCIGSKFKVQPISGGWQCINDAGNSCCPVC